MRYAATVVCVLLVLTSVAAAQFVGIPIADTAASRTPGAKQAGGFVGKVSDGPTFIGARFQYSVNQHLAVFGDLGRLSDYLGDDEDFSATAIQVGTIVGHPHVVFVAFDSRNRGDGIDNFGFTGSDLRQAGVIGVGAAGG